MQISPISTLDEEINQIRQMTAKIVGEDVIPNEHLLRRGLENAQLWGDLVRKVKESGLWAPHLPKEYGGMGIGFLKLAYPTSLFCGEPDISTLQRQDFGRGVFVPFRGDFKLSRRLVLAEALLGCAGIEPRAQITFAGRVRSEFASRCEFRSCFPRSRSRRTDRSRTREPR